LAGAVNTSFLARTKQVIITLSIACAINWGIEKVRNLIPIEGKSAIDSPIVVRIALIRAVITAATRKLSYYLSDLIYNRGTATASHSRPYPVFTVNAFTTRPTVTFRRISINEMFRVHLWTEVRITDPI